VCPESPLPDIDKNDKHNPLAASEYANSIYNYYRRVEPKFNVAHDYMQTQVGANKQQEFCVVLLYCYASCLLCQHALTCSSADVHNGKAKASKSLVAVYLQCEINEKMRGILVDWLVEVHLKFKVSSIAYIAVDLPPPTTTAVRGRPQASLQQHQAGQDAACL
jgi:hypothetical protein